MKYFNSDFTIGIELEAFARISEFTDIDEYEYEEGVDCNYLNNYECEDGDYDPLDEFYSNIRLFFGREFNMYGTVQYDGSVKYYNNGYNGFEWASPVLTYCPKEISKLKNMMKSLKKHDIHINSTCGLHTHFAYKGINESDVLWIIMNIANNPQYVKEFTEFKFLNDDRTLFKENDIVNINFYDDRYADKQYLLYLKNSIEKKQYDEIGMLLSGEKYRAIRIHPQGTLEWRGPRGFLESDNGVDEYIRKLHRVVSIFQKILSTDTLNGMSRGEWFENISESILCCKDHTRVLPERTKKHQKCNAYGILDEFHPNDKIMENLSYFSKSKQRFVNVVSMLIDNMDKNPNIINDSSIAHLIPFICMDLVGRGRLREVIENNVKNGYKLSKNVQYCMLEYNFTLLPFITEEVWKYFSLPRLKKLIFKNGPFSQKSGYKLETINFLLDKLPQILGYDDAMKFWVWFIDTTIETYNKDAYKWLYEHIMYHKEKYIDILKNTSYVVEQDFVLDTIKANLEKIDTFEDLHYFTRNFVKVVSAPKMTVELI